MKVEKSRTITCILRKGVALGIIETLKEKGINSSNLSFARGMSARFEDWGGGGVKDERDILTVLVSEKRAEEIFEYLYEAGKTDSPGGGFLYMGYPISAMPYLLPEIPAETQA